jgi:hypothetical protein
VAKTFGVTAQEALYDMSYVNAIMYSKAVPMYDDKPSAEDKPLYDDTLDANDTSKFNDFEDEEIVRV